MEVYILDTSFDSVCLIDTFKSLIWTERYNQYGDFELCIPVDFNLIPFIKENYYVWVKESDKVMIIEDVQTKTDPDSGSMMIITGRSLESILDRRIIWTKTVLNDTVQNSIKRLLNENIISPTDINRRINGFIFEDSDDANVTGPTIKGQYTGNNLYDVVETICKTFNIGFEIRLNSDNKFVFKLYSGADRSYEQSENPFVVFSPDFENIINSNYYESNRTYRNVTLVAGEDKGEDRKTIPVGEGSDLLRREIFTDARDIQSELEEPIELIETISFTPISQNGINIQKNADEEIVVSGTPTLDFSVSNSNLVVNGISIRAQVSTISTIPKGIYKLEGCPGSYDSVEYGLQIGNYPDAYIHGEEMSKEGIIFPPSGSSEPISNVGVFIDLHTHTTLPEMDSDSNSFKAIIKVSSPEIRKKPDRRSPVVTVDDVPISGVQGYSISISKYTRDVVLNNVFWGKTSVSITYYIPTEDQDFDDYKTYYEYKNGTYVETKDYIFNPNKTYYEKKARNYSGWINLLETSYQHNNIYGSKYKPSFEYYELHPDDYNALLSQRGSESLLENQDTKAFEGQIESTINFIYERDFFKGDIVEIVNEFGIEAKARILEIIRTQDETGFDMYPTFSIIE